MGHAIGSPKDCRYVDLVFCPWHPCDKSLGSDKRRQWRIAWIGKRDRDRCQGMQVREVALIPSYASG